MGRAFTVERVKRKIGNDRVWVYKGIEFTSDAEPVSPVGSIAVAG